MNDEISTTAAAIIANVSTETIRNWIRDFGIGYKSGGRWVVNRAKLNKVKSGELHYETQGRPRGKAKGKNKTKG
jgi:hypothetical protein